jgi:hypothetical protein
MKAEIERFFAEDVSTFTGRLAEFDARIHRSTEAREDQHFRQITGATLECLAACGRLESALNNDRERIQEAQARFQREISPWFDRSWMMHRARTKPRGYPGDHQLLTAMYDAVPKLSGLGGYLDLYLLNSTLGRAVRGRLKAAKSFLVEELSGRRGDVFLLNVACGPCREYVDGFDHAEDCSVHVTCIDADQQALDYVQRHVVPKAAPSVEIECVRYNALRMTSAKANVRKFGRPDVIYSIGLCDYIPDKYMISLLRGWRESLAEDGILYVAFKDARRYDKNECQWLADWYFFQRTEEDCRELYRQAGFDADDLEMNREETGVIMNFVSRVRRPAVVRVDSRREGEREPAHAAPVGQGRRSRTRPR